MNRPYVRLVWSFRSAALLFVVLLGVSHAGGQSDPLPSWNEGPAKQAILAFVQDTTDRRSPSHGDQLFNP
jgi:hypothetical protein